MTALALARRQYAEGGNMFRAGLRIRLAKAINTAPTGSLTQDRLDSIFIEEVSAELRGEPLPCAGN